MAINARDGIKSSGSVRAMTELGRYTAFRRAQSVAHVGVALLALAPASAMAGNHTAASLPRAKMTQQQEEATGLAAEHAKR